MRGEPNPGLSIMDALRLYEQRGFTGQFGVREGGAVKCFSCGSTAEPETFEMQSMRRVEGASDPSDMALVAALECPECGARGTLTISYGPAAAAEDNEAIRRMGDVREAIRAGEWERPGVRGETGTNPSELR